MKAKYVKYLIKQRSVRNKWLYYSKSSKEINVLSERIRVSIEVIIINNMIKYYENKRNKRPSLMIY